MPGHDKEFIKIKLSQLCIVSNVYLGHFLGGTVAKIRNRERIYRIEL